MTLVFVLILLFGYLLISTGRITGINKAAVAIFMGTLLWVLYVCYGTDFVMSQHPTEYTNWLGGAVATSSAVKEYIANNIFLKYVGRAASLVLFLLATMTIVEILSNNGCFDFIKQLMRTHSSRKLIWTLAATTFIISANLDDLTTTVMMLTMMHGIVPNRRQRMIYGATIVVAANAGGALTVIGDPQTLYLWGNGNVTASAYSLTLVVPCLLLVALPTWWLSRKLPERVETGWITMPYRGDDTNLNTWQRLLMLLVGIGGLWFIPTFHNITKLSPFLGALCVLGVLWIVNEIVNRKLMNVDKMIQRRTPRVLQYGVLQMILFVMGILLALSAVQETGALNWFASWCSHNINNVWIMGIVAGAVSTVLDNFATAATFFALSPSTEVNNIYFPLVSYCTAAGGSVLAIGSMSGLALAKMERIHIWWYLRNVGLPVIVSALLGVGFLMVLESVWQHVVQQV